MDYIKNLLNQIDTEENTLYDIVYDLLFFSKFQDTEEEIANKHYCTLDELKEYIDNLEVTNKNT